jgi:hypothetical protein
MLRSKPPRLTATRFPARPKTVVEIASRIWYFLSTLHFNSAHLRSKNSIRSLKTYFDTMSSITLPPVMPLRARFPRLPNKDVHRRD